VAGGTTTSDAVTTAPSTNAGTTTFFEDTDAGGGETTTPTLSMEGTTFPITSSTENNTIPSTNGGLDPILVVLPVVLGTAGIFMILLLFCLMRPPRACVWFDGTARSYGAKLVSSSGRVFYTDLRDLPKNTTGCHQPPFEVRSSVGGGPLLLEVINVKNGPTDTIYLQRGKNYALHVCVPSKTKTIYFDPWQTLPMRRSNVHPSSGETVLGGFIYLPAIDLYAVTQIEFGNLVLKVDKSLESRTVGYAVPY
jgi:hypothetical protein